MTGKQYLFFFALVALVASSNVMNLTDQNFNETISTHKYVMVKFYAPWCGHCKTIAPEFQKLADLVKDNDVIIGEVDATQETQTAEAYDVKGYPTLKFFLDGVVIEYNGARTADDMYGWIKRIGETVLEQITQQKIDQLKTQKNLVVYFGTDADKKKTIELLNIIDTNINYYVSPSSDNNKLVLYPLGKDQIQFSQSLQFSANQIQQWAMLHTLPTVVPLKNKEYLDWVFYDEATMKDVAMFFRQEDVDDQTYANFQQFCQKNKQTLKCCLIDKSMVIYSGVKGYLKSEGNSVLALTRDSLKQAYPYPYSIKELTQQSWDQFITQIAANKHKNLAGQQTKKIQYNNVNSLADDNFTSFIKENDLVFVEFYSPECGHCIQFAGEYENIAKKVHENTTSDIKIAAVDLKLNTKVAAETKIQSFPSFRVYLRGQHVTYEGPRTQESILNFIQTVRTSRPIAVGSIAQVPTPSVIIYDAAQVSSVYLLPALFTRYPIYHLREGSSLKVVLRGEQQKTYSGQITIESISKWLFKLTDPVLVNLLNPNLDNKLQQALSNKVSILGLLDVNTQTSQSLTKILQQYCKDSTLICGYAKKSQQNYKQFSEWLGVVQEDSQLVLINTDSYDKYVFNKPIAQLTVESIGQFVNSVRQGKVQKVKDPARPNQENLQGAQEEVKQEAQEEIKEEAVKEQNKQEDSSTSSSSQNPNASEL